MHTINDGKICGGLKNHEIDIVFKSKEPKPG